MASKIDILTTGYATSIVEENVDDKTKQNKFMRATGSCCLVRASRPKYVLFDTMGPWERESLIARLAQLKIHPGDIQYLVCSHSHPDHVGNLNLFTNAKKHFIGTSVYANDLYDLNCFEPIGNYTYTSPKNPTNTIDVINYQNYQLDTNLSIEPTPGHTLECISLLVDNCDTYGKVALAGDLFENEQDVNDDGIWLAAGSQNPDLQRASRSRIYNKVDRILPGHGALFRTDGRKEF